MVESWLGHMKRSVNRFNFFTNQKKKIMELQGDMQINRLDNFSDSDDISFSVDITCL